MDQDVVGVTAQGGRRGQNLVRLLNVVGPTFNLGRRVRATPKDSQGVHGLLEEATAWLRAKGVAQWDTAYPASNSRGPSTLVTFGTGSRRVKSWPP